LWNLTTLVMLMTPLENLMADLDGSHIVVEHSRGGSGSRRGDDYRREDSRYDRYDDRRGRRGGPPIRTSHRVLVENLSSTCNWRDLKDLCRDVARAQPTYADVYRDGTGVVEFESRDDMKRAIKELDDYKFQGRRVYVKEDKGKGERYEPYSSRSGGRKSSRSPRKSSKSPSPRKGSRSPEKKRSKSPAEKRGRSPSPRKGSHSPSPKKGSRSPSPKRSPADRNGKKGLQVPFP